MLPVQLFVHQGALILRASNSELIILPEHFSALQKLKNPQEFANYFRTKALVNRPARKLFDAWLRKDQNLWNGVFKSIHEAPPDADQAAAASDP